MDVKQVAKLANLSLTPAEEKKFAKQFSETLKTINLINELDTSRVMPTFQVTGLTNVMREDKVDVSRVLSQSEVLKSAPAQHQGYFVVPAIFSQ